MSVYHYVCVLFFGLMRQPEMSRDKDILCSVIQAGYSAIIPNVTLLPSTVFLLTTMRTKIKKKPLSLHISLTLTLHTIASAQSSKLKSFHFISGGFCSVSKYTSALHKVQAKFFHKISSDYNRNSILILHLPVEYKNQRNEQDFTFLPNL